MDKFAASNFTKAVELLRTTELSQKEKLNHFHQISDCILSPSMRSNTNFAKHISSAISVLLLFCEDLDSVTRMNAEENLNKIIRYLETDKFNRVMPDIFNEIKKNGNQKSLRICLNIFAYYCPRIKEKNVKWYALKLLPCLEIIASRKETLLLETLSEFIKSFSKYLQICLNDNETYKLLEVFLADIKSDCTVKRRCSAQNCITLLEYSRNKRIMAKHSLTKVLEYLSSDQQSNTILGVLGFLRLFLPLVIAEENICDCKQIVEIYDLCLYLLNNPNHSIINASLEVINSILSRRNRDLEEILTSHRLQHNEILKKRKSLKNQIFQLKNPRITCLASGPQLELKEETATVSKKDGKETHQDEVIGATGGSSRGVGVDGVLNKQRSSGKSTTETIKDAFKSGRSTVEDSRTRAKVSESEDFNKFNELSFTSSVDGKSKIDSDDFIFDMDVAHKINKKSLHGEYIEQLDDNILTIEINEPQKDDVHLAVERTDDKSQNLSDIDNESFNSIDFESEITIGARQFESDEQDLKDHRRIETVSLKSQKSTDSIGSFFNSLLSHPNTETMTKLFRPSTKLSATTTDSSTTSTPKTKTKHSNEKVPPKGITTASASTTASQSVLGIGIEPETGMDTGLGYAAAAGTDSELRSASGATTATSVSTAVALGSGVSSLCHPTISNVAGSALTLEDDTISLESINSHISLGSHVSFQSSTQDLMRNEQDLVLVHSNDYENEKDTEPRIDTTKTQQQRQLDTSSRVSAMAMESPTVTLFKPCNESMSMSMGDDDDDDDYMDDSLASSMQSFSKTNPSRHRRDSNHGRITKTMHMFDNNSMSKSEYDADASLILKDNTFAKNERIFADDDKSSTAGPATPARNHNKRTRRGTSTISSDDDDDNDRNNSGIGIDIGSIDEQNIIYYTVRLIVSKFLLSGTPNGLFSDTVVRVSIKNLSLNVLASCVKIKPEILGLPIEIDKSELCAKARLDLSSMLSEDNNNDNNNSIDSNNTSGCSSSNSTTNNTGNNTNNTPNQPYPSDDGVDKKTNTNSNNNNKTRRKNTNKDNNINDPNADNESANNDNSSNEICNDFDMGEGDDYAKYIQQEENFHLAQIPAACFEENLLEIKDDHFGESTTKYFDDVATVVATPLSKSADHVTLVTHLKGSGTLLPKNTGDNMDRRQDKVKKSQLNQQLEQFLSKSEIIESKSSLEQTKSKSPAKAIRVAKSPSRGILGVSKYSPSCGTARIAGDEAFRHEPLAGATAQFPPDGGLMEKIDLTGGSTSFRGNIHQKFSSLQKQFVYDILLFHNHSDPILRGDVQIIIGNFISGIQNDIGNHGSLDINRLLQFLVKGLRDEIHTVVIHALTSFDKTFSLLMSNHFNVLNKQKEVDDDDDDDENENVKNQCDGNTDDGQSIEPVMMGSQPKGENNKEIGKFTQDATQQRKIQKTYTEKVIISPRVLLNQLRLCFDNKYWLVQNKYADVVSNLDFESVLQYYGDDISNTYENIFLWQLFRLLGDNDFRVRDHVVECICRYIANRSDVARGKITFTPSSKFLVNVSLLEEFFHNRIFCKMPISTLLCNKVQERPVTVPDAAAAEKLLSRVLYFVTNMLLELDDRNLQCGIISAIKALLLAYNPIDYYNVWGEFNLLDICAKFTYENYSMAIDINGQNDLLEITTCLFSANNLCGKINTSVADMLLRHTMKILNVYNHLFTNHKLLIIPKPQKSDIFINAKELAIINAIGYFGYDYFYIKLYRILKASYETYKITINESSGSKFMTLLTTTLRSLSVLLEFKLCAQTSDTVKIIEETLQYLTILVNYAPSDSIKCLRQLLKFLFGRNYANRKHDYENFIKLYFAARNHHKNYYTVGDEIMITKNEDKVAEDQHQYEFKHHSHNEKQEHHEKHNNASDSRNLGKLFASAMNFPLGKSQSEEECAKYIKLFEPLVIYCLTLFMKSNATVQAPILDLLSQLLEFNVTYSILDSQNVIFEQVMKNLELIETGIARNSTLIMPSILRFLFLLTKQSDKNLISIPKIISMTNGLLANNNIKECSVLALRELAFEIFFHNTRNNGGMINPNSASMNSINSATTTGTASKGVGVIGWGSSGGGGSGTRIDFSNNGSSSLNAKELSTQKEVILGMVEKFISSLECQKILSILLLWEKTRAIPVETQEGEVLSIVTKALDDGKIEVVNCKSFFVLESLFKNSDKNYLLESARYQTFLSLFLKKDVNNFNDLSQIIIILENVIFIAEEIYLTNHIKLYFKNAECDLSAANEINYFAKVLYEKLKCSFIVMKAYSYNAEFRILITKFLSTMKSLQHFDGLKNALRCRMLDDDFYATYFPVTFNDECLYMDVLKLICKLNFDKLHLLDHIRILEKENFIQNSIIILCNHFNDSNEWTIDEVLMLSTNRVIISLIRHRRGLLSVYFLVRDVKFTKIILNAVLERSSNASKLEIANVVEFLEELDTLSFDLKLKILLTILVNKNSGKFLQKKVQHIIKRELEQLKKSLSFSLGGSDSILQQLKDVRDNYLKRAVTILKSDDLVKYINSLLKQFGSDAIDDDSEEFFKVSMNHRHQPVDEEWLIQETLKLSKIPQSDGENVVKILLEFKSESKIRLIFASESFDGTYFLANCIDQCCKIMIQNFQFNCIHFNPHINYMKVHPLFKVALQVLQKTVIGFLELSKAKHVMHLTKDIESFDKDFLNLAKAITILMRSINHVESACLIYIEEKFSERFIKENLLNSLSLCESLIQFAAICSERVTILLKSKESLETDVHYMCIDEILKQKHIWSELNQPDKYLRELNTILDMVYRGMIKSVRNTTLFERCKIHLNQIQNQIRNLNVPQRDETETETETETRENVTDCKIQMGFEQKAIFIAKLVEAKSFVVDSSSSSGGCDTSPHINEKLKSISISLFRTNHFYSLAVTPFELFESFDYERKPHSSCRLPSIPVEHLSDAEILQKFIKRLSIFGFSTRQQFEEYFMTFLLLINKTYDENMVDHQEQFQIKNICLEAILELLMSCKTFPVVGSPRSSFIHFPRWNRIYCDNISTKKLQNVQSFIPGANIFYQPNLERNLSLNYHDDIIGTNYFLTNQYELNYVWRQIEGIPADGDIKEDAPIKNSRSFSEMSGIDLKSSCQLIFDVFTQLIEQNHVLVLPNLTKFCEICDNQNHIRWIKNTMLKYQETIPMDDTISHQYIIYLLCRTQAILIPSYNELSHLGSIISVYLKSSHIFIRNATLHGLLCLLECCSKTNTAMGKLSEELCLVRDLICGYITRHGIIEESLAMFSDVHTKLVWTLNFSLIEMTTKFVPECNLLSNTIISANNLLKRTTNEDIYLCVVYGLERILVSNHVPKLICDKIEKLALELVKLENERYSLPALKLLLSCVYMGSSKQLENTEHSNGIVQDDPEIIVQQTEKVDVLLQRIKSSTSSAAKIYGEVLCQIIRDLVPPNEILTKVIKEFLTINQPHCEVIARIVYQVFRSAIDSSFLQMLQDWLICSLPNFLALTTEKSVWSLTVIFLSASINLHLIKLFPFVLNEFKLLNDAEVSLFITSAQDFYMKLNSDQKKRFKEVFTDNERHIFKEMLSCL